jgi:4'-phosphopantetheinyl transferase
MSAAGIDLWWFPLDPPGEQCFARAAALLGAAERVRLRQFDRPEAAGLFALRRAIRRVILAEYLDAAAGDLAFDEPPGRKPRVSCPATDFEFSASDTGGLGIMAVARGVAVGADIEAERAVDMAGLERRILTPAERALLRLTSAEDRRRRLLLRAWIAKEAVLKGIGTGLDLAAMREIGVVTAPDFGAWQEVAAGAGPGRGWHVWFRGLDCPNAAPAIAAVACTERRPVEIMSAVTLIARHGLR